MRIIQAPRKVRNGVSKAEQEHKPAQSRSADTQQSSQSVSFDESESLFSDSDLNTAPSLDTLSNKPSNSRPNSRTNSRETDSSHTQSPKKEVDIIHKSIELLARREHSVFELEQKLKLRGYPEPMIQTALKQLSGDGLVCNERFTEAYVRHRTLRGFGPVKIAMELKGKGVDGVLLEEYIDASSPLWIELARDCYTKKFGDNAPVNYAEWSKRARFLQSRGFTSGMIQNACPSVEAF